MMICILPFVILTIWCIYARDHWLLIIIDWTEFTVEHHRVLNNMIALINHLINKRIDMRVCLCLSNCVAFKVDVATLRQRDPILIPIQMCTRVCYSSILCSTWISVLFFFVVLFAVSFGLISNTYFPKVCCHFRRKIFFNMWNANELTTKTQSEI